MIELPTWPTSLCLTACTGLLAAAACGPTDLSDLVETTITVGDSVVSTSSPITVSVVATNIGFVRVEVDPYGCRTFDVLDSSGAVVGPVSGVCPDPFRPPVILERGESFGFEYVWSGESSGGAPLPVGTYHLRGWTDVLDRGLVYSGAVEVRLVDSFTAGGH